MPYSSVSDLPDTVKVLPAAAQKIWLAVFNSAWEDSCQGREDQELCAIKQAWGAVKKTYEQDKDGAWKEKANTVSICTRGYCAKSPLHKVILQRLNSWLEYEDGTAFLALDNFAGTEPDWNKVLLIYGQTHPDMRALVEDPEAELKRSGAVIAGRLTDAEVIPTGQPRLEAVTLFTNPEIEQLWKEGKLGVSTGFFAKQLPDGSGNLEGKIQPNHVLLFEMDDENQPRDKGSMFLHKKEVDMEKEFKNEGRVISEKNKTRLKGLLDGLWNFFNDVATDRSEKTHAEGAPAVPPDPAGFKIGPDGNCKVTLADFGDMEFSAIRKHFAFDDGSGIYTGLKLPHHHPKTGDVMPSCVRAGLAAIGGARTGQPMDLEGKKDAVIAHLESHLEVIQKAAEEKENMDETEMKNKIDEAVKEREAQLAEFKAKVDAAEKRATEAEKNLAELQKEKADATWKGRLAKIPAGVLKKEGEEKLRKLYEEDPHGYINLMETFPKGEPSEEEGEDFTQKISDEDAAKVVAEMKEKTGRV